MGVTSLRNILVSTRTPDEIAKVSEDIRRLLRYRHAILLGKPDDFRVRSLEEIVALRTRTTRTMTTLLAAVGAVSLLVGGIGVMNIMLVSVKERTREIGIRLAVGARQRDVLRQFLTEALVVSVIGGLLGLATGVVVARALTEVLGWPTQIVPEAALGAFLFRRSGGHLLRMVSGTPRRRHRSD